MRRLINPALRRFVSLGIATTALFALPITGCGPGQLRYRNIVGESGTEWRVLSKKPMTTRDGQKGIRFRFETETSFDDFEGLSAEVETFLADHDAALEAGRYTVAFVVPATPLTSGWSESRDEYRFRYERGDDGQWNLTRNTRVEGVTGKRRIHVH